MTTKDASCTGSEGSDDIDETLGDQQVNEC